MSDLPIPTPVQGQAQPSAASGIPVLSSAASTDVKLLTAQAIEQIEAAVLQTTTNAAERALQIHSIKEAYLKKIK